MWMLLLQSKMFKASAGLLGGSGLLAFVVGYVDMKDKDIREYVNTKNEVVLSETKHIKENQMLMLDTLKTIDDRLYNLRKGK